LLFQDCGFGYRRQTLFAGFAAITVTASLAASYRFM